MYITILESSDSNQRRLHGTLALTIQVMEATLMNVLHQFNITSNHLYSLVIPLCNELSKQIELRTNHQSICNDQILDMVKQKTNKIATPWLIDIN